MPIISASDLCKSFDHRVILDGVSLTVRSGERVGVVGPNGAGKSTLGAILAGQVEPDSGIVAVRRGARVAYLAQEPRFERGLNVREAVLSGLYEWSEARMRYDHATAKLDAGADDSERWLGEQSSALTELERHGGWQRLHEAENLLGRLGVEDLEATVDDLSGGRRRAVALAQVLLSQPTLAVLDEPTNHLDIATIEWLEEYLRDDYRGALILITHDRYVLDRVTERTIELEGGALYTYEGGFERYLTAKAERAELADRAEANRRNFLRQELEWLRRGPKARGGKQKARIQRAEAAIARGGPARDGNVELQLVSARTGKSLLDVEDLALEIGGKRLVEGLTLRLVPGERIGIVGPNGCGKTTLLRAVLGEVEPAAGTVTLGKNTRIAYLDQMRSGLDEAASVEQNVADGCAYLDVGGRSLSVHTYLERFLFDSSSARRPVATLSGGERARVALAKMLASSANLLVLDEPTNDLDVDTLAALESMILEFEGAALIVSHDRWFLDRLATSILAFESPTDGAPVIERHAGNYSDYRERAASAAAAAAEAQRADRQAIRNDRRNTGTAASAADRPRKLTYAERIELDGLLDRIEQAEAAVAELEARVGDPALYASGGDAVRETMRLLDEARARAHELTERWEELEARA